MKRISYTFRCVPNSYWQGNVPQVKEATIHFISDFSLIAFIKTVSVNKMKINKENQTALRCFSLSYLQALIIIIAYNYEFVGCYAFLQTNIMQNETSMGQIIKSTYMISKAHYGNVLSKKHSLNVGVSCAINTNWWRSFCKIHKAKYTKRIWYMNVYITHCV